MEVLADRIRALVDRRGAIGNRDVVDALRVSPATAHRVLQSLVLGGVLERHGRGRAAHYRFPRPRFRFRLRGLDENEAWQRIAGAIARTRPLGASEMQSLEYATTEVLNNAVDHSGGHTVWVSVVFAERGTTVMTVGDDGVGVFRRIREDFGLTSPHDAILQLEKGKLTSDPARHSGEGLFFSSKAVSRFRLEGEGTAWIVDNEIGDSAIGASLVRRGTRVELAVVRGHTPRLEEVFRAYTDPETLRFTGTRTTVKLAGLGTALVSRSEAKRLVARLPEFTHVTLDFSGVDVVGQGFCDEVFRVFARAHPRVTLEPVGMNDAVAFMVARARVAGTRRSQPRSSG